MANELFIKKVLIINAQTHKVWHVLTDPVYIRQYMHGCDVETDWNTGSPIIFKNVHGVFSKGEILTVEPEKLLQYTAFAPGSGIKDKSGNYLTVTYELFPGYGNTNLTVTEGNFAKVNNSDKRYNDALEDWDFIFSKVKELAENLP